MSDIQLLQAQILGGNISNNPHFINSGRDANALITNWGSGIPDTSGVITHAINNLNSMARNLEIMVNSFEGRFNDVIGRESSVDGEALKLIQQNSENLIQAVNKLSSNQSVTTESGVMKLKSVNTIFV